MTKNEALELIHAADWRGSVPGLERVSELLSLMGDPQEKLRCIHIAGTNGKGSTAAMLAEVLKRAGYRTGLYISPHLSSYNERMSVDGEYISDEDFCACAEAVAEKLPLMKDVPTEFERVTAMGFKYFADRGCDLVVLEVGLGGRLDATNAIRRPALSVICNLDLEHTEYLGDTIEKIAFEKAGIIKTGRPVVLYGQTPEAEGVVRARCEELGCSLRVTDAKELSIVSESLFGQVIDYRERKNVALSLIGRYQAMNAMTVLDSIDELRKLGYVISEEAVRSGLENTVWPGRFQVLMRDPVMMVDGAHNPNGVRALAKCLKAYMPGRKFTFVMGVMADKDYGEMLEEIGPLAEAFIAVTPGGSKRALASSSLREKIETELGVRTFDAGSVEEGLNEAVKRREAGSDVIIFGSLYQVGEVLDHFALQGRK